MPTRPSLTSRLDAFVDASTSSVALVSAAPGAGKTAAVKQWGRATCFEFDWWSVRGSRALDCALAAIDAFSPPAPPASLLPAKPPRPKLDPYVALVHGLFPMSQPKPGVVFCVDAPERCEDSRELLRLLLVTWPELAPKWCKLIVLTSLSPLDLPSNIHSNVTMITRISSKPVEADEAISEFFRGVLSDDLKVDPEWSTEVIDLATQRARGSFYSARLFVPHLRSLHQHNKLFAVHLARALPASLDAALEQAYQPYMGPFLVARDKRMPKDVAVALLQNREPGAEDLVEAVMANGGRDWFRAQVRKYRWVDDGHGPMAQALLSTMSTSYACSHVLYHLMEAGELEKARGLLFDQDSLSRLCAGSASNLVSDALRLAQLLPRDVALRVLAGMLHLGKDGLNRDFRELRGQLMGRFQSDAVHSEPAKTELTALIAQFKKAAMGWRAWLPSRPSLDSWPVEMLNSYQGLHVDTILSTSLNGDGTLCVTGSVDGCAQVFDVGSGRVVYTLDAIQAGFVSACSASRTSKHEKAMVLTGHQDGVARLWRLAKADGVANREMQTLIGHTDVVSCVSFLHPNTFVAITASCDKTARLWSLPNEAGGECLCTSTLRGHSDELFAATFVGDSLALTGDKKGEVRLWNVHGECLSHLPAAHFSHISCLASSPSGHLVASAAWDCHAKLWATKSTEPDSPPTDALWTVDPVATLTVKEWVWSVAFVDDARVVTATDSGAVDVWSASAPFACLASLSGHTQAVYCLASAGDGRVVTGGLDPTCRRFEVPVTLQPETAKEWRRREQIQGPVSALVFVTTPDQVRYAYMGTTAGGEAVVQVLDLETAKVAKSLPGHTQNVCRLSVSHDGARVLSGDEDAELIWDARRMEQIKGAELICCCFIRSESWEDNSLAVAKSERVVALGRDLVGLTLDTPGYAWTDVKLLDYVVAVDQRGVVHVLTLSSATQGD